MAEETPKSVNERRFAYIDKCLAGQGVPPSIAVKIKDEYRKLIDTAIAQGDDMPTAAKEGLDRLIRIKYAKLAQAELREFMNKVHAVKLQTDIQNILTNKDEHAKFIGKTFTAKENQARALDFLDGKMTEADHSGRQELLRLMEVAGVFYETFAPTKSGVTKKVSVEEVTHDLFRDEALTPEGKSLKTLMNHLIVKARSLGIPVGELENYVPPVAWDVNKLISKFIDPKYAGSSKKFIPNDVLEAGADAFAAFMMAPDIGLDLTRFFDEKTGVQKSKGQIVNDLKNVFTDQVMTYRNTGRIDPERVAELSEHSRSPLFRSEISDLHRQARLIHYGTADGYLLVVQALGADNPTWGAGQGNSAKVMYAINRYLESFAREIGIVAVLGPDPIKFYGRLSNTIPGFDGESYLRGLIGADPTVGATNTGVDLLSNSVELTKATIYQGVSVISLASDPLMAGLAASASGRSAVNAIFGTLRQVLVPGAAKMTSSERAKYLQALESSQMALNNQARQMAQRLGGTSIDPNRAGTAVGNFARLSYKFSLSNYVQSSLMQGLEINLAFDLGEASDMKAEVLAEANPALWASLLQSGMTTALWDEFIHGNAVVMQNKKKAFWANMTSVKFDTDADTGVNAKKPDVVKQAAGREAYRAINRFISDQRQATFNMPTPRFKRTQNAYRSGTVTNAAMGAFTAAMSVPYNLMRNHINAAIRGRGSFAGMPVTARTKYMVGFVAATFTGGLLYIMATDALKGEPQPLDHYLQSDQVLRALISGGTFGLLGDILAQDHKRYGGDPIDSFGIGAMMLNTAYEVSTEPLVNQMARRSDFDGVQLFSEYVDNWREAVAEHALGPLNNIWLRSASETAAGTTIKDAVKGN